MSWQAINLGAPEFASRPEPPTIVGLFYRGKRHVLSGAFESAKTLLCWIAALEHVRAGGVVAHIDLGEMGPEATRLLLDELGATKDDFDRINYFDPEGPPTAADIETILELGATLVVVDAAAGAYDLSGSTTTSARTPRSSPAHGYSRSGSAALPRSSSTT